MNPIGWVTERTYDSLPPKVLLHDMTSLDDHADVGAITPWVTRQYGPRLPLLFR